MKASLYIIVDVSGSMTEMGKIHLQRNLCRYASQLKIINKEKYSNVDFYFYQWAQAVSKITLQSDGDIPILNSEDSTKLCTLSDFLSQQLNAGSTKFLVLSDGHFDHDDYASFGEWKKENKLSMIRTVAVGADADLFKLKKISTNNTVYLSENIASAIDNTLFGSDEPLTAPVSTAQILQSTPAEAEEPEEDWDA